MSQIQTADSKNMTFLERVNSILISMLVGLALFQMGMVLYIKNVKDQAQKDMDEHMAQTDLECGRDQFKAEAYWDIKTSMVGVPEGCTEQPCLSSEIHWGHSGQTEQLHIISVDHPPKFDPINNQSGGVVDVVVPKVEVPFNLALVSQSPIQWNLKLEEGATLEKVIVAGRSFVWLEGRPEKTELIYLPKEKMCSYPLTWQDAFNSENQFRDLLVSLEKVTGLKATSFQGAVETASFEFDTKAMNTVTQAAYKESSSSDTNFIAKNKDSAKVLPVAEAQQGRAPASVAKSEGVLWKRSQGRLEVSGLKSLSSSIEGAGIDFKGVSFYAHSEKLKTGFAIKKGRLYSVLKGKFHEVVTPVGSLEIEDVQAAHYDKSSESLYLYNDRRAGELYRYDIQNQGWELLNDGVNKTISALYFDPQSGNLYALGGQPRFLNQLYVFNELGELQKEEALNRPVAVDPQRWSWEINGIKSEASKSPGKLSLRLHTVTHPEGRIVSL